MKTVIVTGASGNLGYEVVKKFINENYFVIGTVTSNDDTIFDFSEDKFEKVAIDLTNEKASEKLIEEINTKHKNIDVAVLTVGGFAMGNIASTKATDILKQYQLNFETTYNIAKPVFDKMLQQNHGRIFMIGSKPGLSAKNSKGMIAYGLSKSLIFRLAELMNDEAKGKNVVTSVIVPSTIDTPSNRKSMPDADFGSWVKPKLLQT